MIVVDAGNTRLKWASVDAGQVVDIGSAAHGASVEASVGAFVSSLRVTPKRVLVANVAGDRMARALIEALRSCGAPAPKFVAVEAEGHGIRCGYADPTRLGVDRWVAAIAAHALVGDAVAIIDAGTTVTLDVVAADGQHLGGLIFAGPRLTALALARGTQGIGTTPPPTERPRGLAVLGHDTDEAVGHAAQLAVAAGIEHALSTVADALGHAPEVMLTGGDAVRLRDWLETDPRLRADLVLEGLALIAAGRR